MMAGLYSQEVFPLDQLIWIDSYGYRLDSSKTSCEHG